MDRIEVRLVRHLETAGNLEKRYVGKTDEDLSQQGIVRGASLVKEKQMDLLVISPMRRCLETALLLTGYPPEDLLAMLSSAPVSTGKLLQEAEKRLRAENPACRIITAEGLKECDFGAFEYKNWQEMQGDPRYQAWIDSGGTLAFPEGEEPKAFRTRCTESFQKIMCTALRQRAKRVVMVVHGGTIMSIMDAFYARNPGEEAKSYFDFHVGSGEGYELLWNGQQLEDMSTGSGRGL